MWVSEAFGRRFGLFAVYVQWLVSLTFQPAVLSYSATAVAYVLNPEIAQSGSYTAIVTVAGTWVLALLGCCGFRVQCYMITACVLVGTLLPLVTVTCIVAVRLVDSGGFMDALPTDIGSAPHLNDFKVAMPWDSVSVRCNFIQALSLTGPTKCLHQCPHNGSEEDLIGQ